MENYNMSTKIKLIASKKSNKRSDDGTPIFKVKKIKVNGVVAELPHNPNRKVYVSEDNTVFYSVKNGSIRPYAENRGAQRMDLNSTKYRLTNMKVKFK